MTQQQIQKGNKIIAEFDGWRYVKNDDSFSKPPNILFSQELEYHQSWDWLMPVIEQINEKCKHTGYVDTLEISHLRLVSTKIDYAYYAALEYIKWYNENIIDK
jgi:hypothetical protein